ncbi:hypothetical protein CC86DRAFT_146416 [Ophiobolus disseminans]|uniref:Mediator of RNA polymerase II transcription subunit 20 n=1 Tax=Ophiobolus disseminans TaxID=1469910 RepID=A0A6A6ZFH0_9PLEO|nr:hypothetical protein CC86DRAFT_146416 [Ophiobolus disseminans]
MKYCGLYLNIENKFPTAARQAAWSLQYRVFRNTIPPAQPNTDAEGKPQQVPHTLQHHLHLSSVHQDRTYICIQPPTGTSTVSAIPLSQQDAHASLVRHQFAALWQPRHVLALNEGTSYTIGQCTVQIGELRAIREGPQSGGTQSPGVVVCISTLVGEDSFDDGTDGASVPFEEDGDDDYNFVYAQTMVRECWNLVKEGLDLGRSEVREVMMAPEYVNGNREKDAAVRMWCETLRLRG